jgi:hypothetical protein
MSEIIRLPHYQDTPGGKLPGSILQPEKLGSFP